MLVMSSAFCGMLEAPAYLYEFSSIIFFLLPLLALVFMYSMMGWKLVTASRRRQSLMTVGDGGRGDWNNKTKKTVLKMLGETKVSNFYLERKKESLFVLPVFVAGYCKDYTLHTTQIHHISYSSPVISLLNIWETNRSQKINESSEQAGNAQGRGRFIA